MLGEYALAVPLLEEALENARSTQAWLAAMMGELAGRANEHSTSLAAWKQAALLDGGSPFFASELALALKNLAVALGEVASFVKDNRATLTSDISGLADVTGVLAKQKDALAEILDDAPDALSNLQNAYNPGSGTLDTRDNGLGSLNAEIVVCGALAQVGRIDLANDLPLPLPDPTAPVRTATEQICARLLSGDANADNSPDDLNGNKVPDLQELLTLLGGGGATGSSGGRPVIGLPSVPGSQG